MTSNSYKSKATDKRKNQFFTSVALKILSAFAPLLFGPTPCSSYIQQGEKFMMSIPTSLRKVYGRTMMFHFTQIFYKSTASSTPNVMKRPMGPLVHRAEIDSGRQMACQTKARPIRPTGAVRIDEVGPPGLLQHYSERVVFK